MIRRCSIIWRSQNEGPFLSTFC